jgi:hypothetical protein
MGDRANIVIREKGTPDLYVYTHWAGWEWPEEARKALAAGRGRWGDSQYLNRIIVREVFAGLDGDTGGGLSTVIGDNAYPLIVVEHSWDKDEEGKPVSGYVYLVDEETGQALPAVRGSPGGHVGGSRA